MRVLRGRNKVSFQNINKISRNSIQGRKFNHLLTSESFAIKPIPKKYLLIWKTLSKLLSKNIMSVMKRVGGR